MPLPDPSSVHADCLAKIVAKIQSLSLVGIASTNIGTQEVVSDVGSIDNGTTQVKITDDSGNLAGSFISVSPWGQEDIADFSNNRDNIDYKCLVAIIAKRDDPELARKLEWREWIRGAFLNLKIDVPTVVKCHLQMNPVVEPQIYLKKAAFFSSMLVVCESIETRRGVP